MTSLLTHALKPVARLPSEQFAFVEPALSSATREVVLRLRNLQRAPSPGSLASEAPVAKTIQEQFFDALAAVKVLTSQVAMHLDATWRIRLFQQLDSLHDPAEWEEGDEPISPGSFRTFLKAILTIRPQRPPGLGLSHGGNLVAAWTTGADRLTVEFMPQDRVKWVLTWHSQDGLARYAGDIPVTQLRDALAKHESQHWFSNAA